MCSLPYLFDQTSFRTIDLVNAQLNINDDNRQIPRDLSVALEPLWYDMRSLGLTFTEKQHISLTFLRALPCPTRNHSE
jgi:hypothetical protein